jgi:hypothetical protein
MVLKTLDTIRRLKMTEDEAFEVQRGADYRDSALARRQHAGRQRSKLSEPPPQNVVSVDKNNVEHRTVLQDAAWRCDDKKFHLESPLGDIYWWSLSRRSTRSSRMDEIAEAESG